MLGRAMGSVLFCLFLREKQFFGTNFVSTKMSIATVQSVMGQSILGQFSVPSRKHRVKSQGNFITSKNQKLNRFRLRRPLRMN